MNNNKISIIIPVFNEERSILDTINRVKKTLNDLDYNSEIIVVNDGSNDKSYTILKKIKGIKLLRHFQNKGYGASLKNGIKNSTGDLIIITDADGTYPIEDIPKMLKYINNFDMVVGVRNKKNIPLIRKPAKFMISLLANFLTSQKIPDLNSGLRVFKKELALKFWNLFPQGFSFTTTITMASLTNGYSVKFIPINYYKRKGKSSIHPIKDTIGFIHLIFRLSLYFNPLKVFIPLSIIMLILAILRSLRDVIISTDNHIGNLAIVLFFMSFQLFFFGLLADIINKK